MERQIVATTKLGQVQGEDREGVAVFRGIPYGADCGGSRRFLPPMPAQPWQGVRDCTRNGPYAVQFGASISGSEGFGPYFSGGHPERFGVAEERQGEDCLVLNVVTPGLSGKRPVVVYIHGGGFAAGSGTLVLGADVWAREEDLVVVGVNHRLNVFGYLYLGGLDPRYTESGMAGMLDLVLALQWVQDNIAAFGGDPEQVTLMGESGGGMKVSTLLAMDKAVGLFRAAIVESGSNVVGRTSPEEGTRLARLLLRRLGLEESQLEALQTLPASQILAATRDLPDMGFGPVADGINLAYQPEDRFVAPDTARDIPLLVGSSEDEMAAFVPLETLPDTWEAVRAALLQPQGGPARGPVLTPERVDEVIRVFRAQDQKGDDPGHLYLKIISLRSFLGGGAFHQALSKAEQGGAPVYHYLITYDAPHPVHPERRYAWHTADLPLQMRVVLHPECEALSRTMAASWAAFIRTGNPSTEALPWPAFTPGERQVMVLDEPCRVQTDPLQALRPVLA